MRKPLCLAHFAVLAGVLPTYAQHDVAQAPMLDHVDPQPPVSAEKKPLVDSEALQKLIKADNLLARAEHLYEIAKLGEPEYNHPTRVIGSEGG